MTPPRRHPSGFSRKVVCFGEALIDFLGTDGNGPGTPRAFLQYAGGAPANAAAAVARLGGDAEFVGMLGADMFGDFLLDSLAQSGVGTRYVRRTDRAKTALAFVSLDAHGERSFSFYRPPAADLLFSDSDFDDACFAQAAIFHVCSNSLTDAGIASTTLEGMARARAAGAIVSMDLNLRPALWDAATDPLPRLWQALAAADIIKLAGNELAYLADRDPEGADGVLARLRLQARLVVVTDGAAPVRWYTRDAQGAIPTFEVKAVDTTAAGDAFIGGLLSELQRQEITADRLDAYLGDTHRLGDHLHHAAACGALAVTRHGSVAALPTREEVEALRRGEALPA